MTTSPSLRRAVTAKIAFGLVLVLCIAAPTQSFAQTFTGIFSFDGTNGANPYGTLALGSDGNFYGTSQFGGAGGQGTVFKITPGGAQTVLYNFCAGTPQCDSNGDQPFAGLIQGTDGIFYGGTLGAVFSITTSGDLSTLYTFCSLPECADGIGLYDALVQGTDGNFYGATEGGGAVSTYECEGGCGTVFKITPGGTLTTLYSFHGTDGYQPNGGLVQWTDGNFYGTTRNGGAHQSGTVFKITPTGALTLLHSFTGADGYSPNGALTLGTDGNFYGTTQVGGQFNGGAIFKITPSGTFTLLRSFNSSNGGGYGPFAGLVQASDGNFYGAAFYGGTGVANCPLLYMCGTIFRFTPAGKLTTIYNFCAESGCPEGGGPFGALVQGAGGSLYGSTVLGGSTGNGTVFEVSIGSHQKR